MDQVYHSLLALARFFEETEDFWLSDHFYGSCLMTSLKIRGDGRRKESEANCNMGLASEKRGEQKNYEHCTEIFITSLLNISLCYVEISKGYFVLFDIFPLPPLEILSFILSFPSFFPLTISSDLPLRWGQHSFDN